MKRHGDHRNSYQGLHVTGAGSQLSALVHVTMTGSGVQADMVLDKLLSSMSPFLGSRGECLANLERLSLTVTHFCQRGHTYSNKAAPPKRAALYGGQAVKCESMWAILIIPIPPVPLDRASQCSLGCPGTSSEDLTETCLLLPGLKECANTA